MNLTPKQKRIIYRALCMLETFYNASVKELIQTCIHIDAMSKRGDTPYKEVKKVYDTQIMDTCKETETVQKLQELFKDKERI